MLKMPSDFVLVSLLNVPGKEHVSGKNGRLTGMHEGGALYSSRRAPAALQRPF
jgi:hypothetical protein